MAQKAGKRRILLVGDPAVGKTTFINTACTLFRRQKKPAHGRGFDEVAEFDTFVLIATQALSDVARDEIELCRHVLRFQRAPLLPAGDRLGIRVATNIPMITLEPRGSVRQGYFECDPSNPSHVRAMLNQLLA
jgi:GTPase SAR1 family protein